MDRIEKRAFDHENQTPLCIIDALGLGYPSLGCVSAGPNSVSPGKPKCTPFALIEHSLCLKKSRGFGGWPPRNFGEMKTRLLIESKTVAVPLSTCPSFDGRVFRQAYPFFDGYFATSMLLDVVASPEFTHQPFVCQLTSQRISPVIPSGNSGESRDPIIARHARY